MPTSPTPEAAEGEDDDGPYNEDEGQTDGGKAGQAGANEEEEDDEEGEEAENEGSGEVDMSNKTIKELMSMRRTGKPMSKTDGDTPNPAHRSHRPCGIILHLVVVDRLPLTFHCLSTAFP